MAKINSVYDIGAAFEAIENELIASMIRNFEDHKQTEIDEKKQWSMWQAEMLHSLEKYKHDNRKKYGKQFKDINQSIKMLISLARSEGGMNQEKRILEAITKGFPVKRITKGGTAEFFKINDRKLDALIQATMQDMQKAETAVLRMADDQYRQIIYNAQVYANTGAGTYEKAVDMASKDFLKAGLNCIEYANGSRHTIADYADMAIRTASKRAYLQGEGQMRQEWGLHLVIINKRGRGKPCPLCVPFVGKIMIDDVWSGGSRKDGKYPLMSSAIAAGLYHPRCRDSHTTYFPGITTVDPKYNKQEIDDLEKQTQQEARQQYAQRQEKKFGRLAEFSLDPENQQKYEQKQKEWKHARMRTGDMISQEYTEEQKIKAFFKKPLDVTQEWKAEKKKPGGVKELFEYNANGEKHKVDGKRVLLDYSIHEKNIAELIAKETGRKVEMVPRITFPQGIQTPDYLIDGACYDLKTPLGNGKNTLYGMVKSKKRQANNFVICADKTEMTVDELRRQIEDIFRSRNTAFVDTIVLIKDNTIVNIYKRNK